MCEGVPPHAQEWCEYYACKLAECGFFRSNTCKVINSVDQVRKELLKGMGELIDDSFAQRLKRSINLHATTNLGKSYEASVVWAITYEAGQVPKEGVLFSDALNFATLLRETYRIVNNVKSTSPPVDQEVSEMHMPFVELGEELFFKPATFFVEVNDLLDDRPQAIFYGPPGTGKTWAALKLAEVIAGDESRTKLVQFHASYAYEDFIEGWRPTQEGNFEITDGPLKRMAADARDNTNQKFVLVIDEINRANLSKVLGELFFLLEYRDRAITLQYSDEQFKLPKNLFIIGTMNTADRSIALVDVALRRRFHFHGFFPDREPIQGLLKRWLVHEGQSNMSWVADLVDKANSKLNERDLAIGPSHFMKDHLDEEKVQRIWKRSIMPYIEDYFFDDPDQAEEFSYDHLRNDTQP